MECGIDIPSILINNQPRFYMDEKIESSSQDTKGNIGTNRKPPLPPKVSRKRQASDSSVIDSLYKIKRLSPFHSKKRKRVKSMGSACTKGVQIFDRQEGKRIPKKQSPTRNQVAPKAESNELQVKYTSMDTIALHSNSNIDIMFMNEQEEIVKSRRQSDNILRPLNQISCSNNGLSNSELNLPSTVIPKQKPSSLPDLRQKVAATCKSTRSKSCSNTGLHLKSTHGSTNLLENDENNDIFIIRNKRNSSSTEMLVNFPRRKSRPTLENTIHVLEEDKVNYYQIMEEIGKGSFGSVYKCKSFRDNCCYAMKIISKNRLTRKNRMLARRPGKISKNDPLEPLHREIAILKKMDHPYVVKLIEVINDIQVDNVYMVFELMPHGEVLQVPTENPITEEKARCLFRELLLGIEYLHYSKIVHRDIKPSNLLLDEGGHIKIADFGVSNMFEGDDDLISKYAGSPAFQAPEVLNYDSRDKYSGKAVDVWAMGVTLYCFLYGKCPFFSNNIGELCELIKDEPVTFPDEPAVNPQVIDLISRMLSKEPKKRITVVEIKKHPWVTEGGIYVLPATDDHCKIIEVTEEEVQNSIKIISKLSSLVQAKSILKGKSFRKASKLWKRNHSLPDTENNLGVS